MEYTNNEDYIDMAPEVDEILAFELVRISRSLEELNRVSDGRYGYVVHLANQAVNAMEELV